jgi:hypothetical protein
VNAQLPPEQPQAVQTLLAVVLAQELQMPSVGA